jgi:tRNA (mo5U34)-methyltransferase
MGRRKKINKEQKPWYQWKNLKPKYELLQKVIQTIPNNNLYIKIDDYITIGKSNQLTQTQSNLIYQTAKSLMPWRKGPFELFGLDIDTEWKSYIKYNLIEKHFDITDKVVADVGCNNGYYMFKMIEKNPKKLIGFDPAPLYKMQFDFINHFIQSNIEYELSGVEDLPNYHRKFDFIFMLGVLYHRPDPINSLKSLAKSLNPNGEILIDTFMIDGDDEVALTPHKTYSKIPNIYFIPTIPALKNWLHRAGFGNIEILAITKTELNEQRKTLWIDTDSLDDFLDPNDSNKTVEGYPAPKRVYIKCKI